MSGIMEAVNLSKSYSGVTVLRDFSLRIQPGEVHALIGHNGAGKSTVIRMLSGSEPPTDGIIRVDNETVSLSSPKSARDLGIYTVFQELRLIDQLSIAQNIFLGKELRSHGFLNQRKMEQDAQAILVSHGLGHLDVRRQVKTLSHAEKQLVEIVSSLNNDARFILLDEPTTALQATEIENLLDTIRNLSERGISFLFITHKIKEAFSVCTHVTVLRNGRVVSSTPVEQTSEQQVLQYVAGTEKVEITQRTITTQSSEAAGVLEVRHLRSDVLNVPHFLVRKGQVVGFYGLVGSGRTEFLEALFGAHRYTSGEMMLGGERYHPKSPTQAVRRGVLLLTEERKRNGIVPLMNAQTNMILASLRNFHRLGFLKRKAIDRRTNEFVKRLSIKGDVYQPIVRLSGGNQQKVLLGRWLLPSGQLLLLDEPTKGVDIGVKMEIHVMIRQLASEGYAVLVVSSEAEEIMAVSDVVAVMHRGTIKAMLTGADISEERLLTESLEGHEDEAKVSQ